MGTCNIRVLTTGTTWNQDVIYTDMGRYSSAKSPWASRLWRAGDKYGQGVPCVGSITVM